MSFSRAPPDYHDGSGMGTHEAVHLDEGIQTPRTPDTYVYSLASARLVRVQGSRSRLQAKPEAPDFIEPINSI